MELVSVQRWMEQLDEVKRRRCLRYKKNLETFEVERLDAKGGGKETYHW